MMPLFPVVLETLWGWRSTAKESEYRSIAITESLGRMEVPDEGVG